MDPVRRRDPGLEQEARRLDVGGDHAFLDQLVRIVAQQHAGLGDLAAVVQHEAHFGTFELDRPAPRTRPGQHLVELVQALHVGQQRADLGDGLGIVLAHRLPHLGVGQPRMRVHHRLVELRAHHLAFVVHLHVADKAHAVDLRHQRADAVGQGLRQHRHHEAGEVHRGGAKLRLLVQRRTRPHVVRHIGNRHHQAETLEVGFAVHRVVEVLGVLAVDGHQRGGAQIHPVADHRRLDRQRHRGGLVQHRRREFVRQVVAVDGRLDHQRRSQAVAQHRHHLADRRAPRIGRLHQLAHHQLAFARTAGAIRRHLHVALHAAVVGDHEADPGLTAEATDQAVDPVLEHPGDAALAAAAAVDAGHVRQHAVAVHDLAHLGRRQEQVVAATRLRTQEAEALGIGDHCARDQVGRLQRGEAATAVLDQLPVADHRAQALAQRVQAVGFGQAQQARQFLGALRPLGGVQHAQDRLAAGNRVGVATGLARGLRIVEA